MLIEEEEQPIIKTTPSTTPVEGANETTATKEKVETPAAPAAPAAATGGGSKLVTEIQTARGIVKLPGIFDACKTGHLPIIRYYIENDPTIDIDAVDEGGGTLLHWAAYNGYADIVVYLITKGADVNSRSVPSKQ